MIWLDVDINFDLTVDWNEAQNAVHAELRRLGVDMRRHAEQILRDRGRKATGDLIDSLDEEVWSTPDGFVLEMGPHVTYGLFVETGTKPHWPPIDPLKKWARVKFGATGREKDAIAYAVQRKIAKEGTKPTPYIEETHRFFLPLAANRLADAIERGLA